MENTFALLNSINVNEHIEQKGQFSYLSWPFAVAQLRLADPTAYWEVRRFDGLPFLKTDCGVFVEVAVTVQGVTLSQVHPVLDGKNRPLYEPNSFDINTSIQRALVKAIALHGLGLYIYAGEDLPTLDGNEAPQARPQQPVVPASKPSGKVAPLNRPDARRGNNQELLTPAQHKYLTSLIDKAGIDTDKLLEHFGFFSLESIPKAEVNRIIKAIESYRRKAA